MKTTCVWMALLAPLACAHSIERDTDYRETREIRTVFLGALDVDASPVGAIRVQGWDEPGVLIRAEVDANSAVIAAQVLVTENGGVVRATGPLNRSNGHDWAVSYEIFLPHAADLTLRSNVGAITVDAVAGKIRCEANVGSLHLTSLAGDVECSTSVGAISLALAGDHWEGDGLNARTNVGGVELTLPAHYSAHLELSTGLGSVTTTAPLPVRKKGLASSVSADLGAGGATISAATKVGGVSVKAAR